MVGRYLRERFVDAASFAAHCGVDADELCALIAFGLEYARSVRKRLVEDMLPRVTALSARGEITSP